MSLWNVGKLNIFTLRKKIYGVKCCCSHFSGHDWTLAMELFLQRNAYTCICKSVADILLFARVQRGVDRKIMRPVFTSCTRMEPLSLALLRPLIRKILLQIVTLIRAPTRFAPLKRKKKNCVSAALPPPSFPTSIRNLSPSKYDCIPLALWISLRPLNIPFFMAGFEDCSQREEITNIYGRSRGRPSVGPLKISDWVFSYCIRKGEIRIMWRCCQRCHHYHHTSSVL